MNDKPTDSQIRELWEKCGFKYDTTKTKGFVHDIGWRYPDGHVCGGCHISYLPPIDLNNLSRYAIPKFIKEYHNWKSVLHDWVEGLTGDYEKDTLSLYWLLAQTVL